MKRTFLAFLIIFATFLPSIAARKFTRAEYIAAYKDIAIQQMQESGIPASITLAQGCLESADGNSDLATEAHNHFGIKCHSWKGRGFYKDDDAKNECFRAYDEDVESFKDHSDFLRYSSRYSKLFDLNPEDYKGWAYGLKEAGYATNPQYPEMLIKIIEENQLYNYDRTVISQTVFRAEENNTETAETIPPSPSELKAPVKVTLKRDNPHSRISLEREVYTQNGVAFIIAEEYDTYSKIAREFNLFKRELLYFNDLKKDSKIEKGTRIYIEIKKKSAPRHLEKHVVEDGESLYTISQEYGIRLRFLHKYNTELAGSEPLTGSMINLRRQ